MAVLPLRHFSTVEFRCKCGCGVGMEKMDADLLQMLDEARELAGIPFPLSSAYRCPKHNKAIGGVPTELSRHSSDSGAAWSQEYHYHRRLLYPRTRLVPTPCSNSPVRLHQLGTKWCGK